MTQINKPTLAQKRNSAHYRKIAHKTAENMLPRMIERYDRFINYILEGHNRQSAAILAGCKPRSASKTSSEMWHTPYVQEKLRQLREAADEEQLITRKEQLLDLKGIAMNIRGGPQGRVQAHALLAKIMGREAATKIETEVTGGVMFVPAPTSDEEWEKQAAAAQAKLQEEVRE